MEVPDERRGRGVLGALGLVVLLVLVWVLWPERGVSLPRHGLTPAVSAVPGRTVRLAPRLVDDGRSAAEVAAEVRVVDEVEVRPGARRVRVRGGALVAPEDFTAEGEVELPAGGGVVLVPSDGAARAALLLEDLGWDADEISELRVTVVVPRPATTRATFRTAADRAAGLGDDAFRGSSRREARVGRAREVELVYDFSDHPHWRGRVEAVQLELAEAGWPTWIGRVRAVARDLVPGASPVELDGALFDAGLVELGRELADPDEARYEMRRAFPALAGRDQAVALATPEGARLAFAIGLPPRWRGLSGEVRFEIVAGVPAEPWSGGEAPGEAWTAAPRTIWTGSLDPGRDAGLWHAHEVHLAPEPQTVLWFRTRGGAPAGRVNGLWGTLRVSVPGAERPTSVLFVTADTLRMDHVGAYGLEPVATPHIDALAARGALFRDCMSIGNSTSPSHASLFTGVHPKDHRVTTNMDRLPEGILTLAERMAASGRTCLSASAVRHLDAQRSGLGQGVDLFFNTPPTVFEPPGDDDEVRALEGRPGYRSATAVNRGLLDVLGELGDEPFYAWVHYYDAHTPYEPEPEFADRYGARPPEPGAPDALDALVQERVEIDPSFREFHPRGEPDGEGVVLDAEQLRLRFDRDFPMLDFLSEYRDPAAAAAAYRAEVAQLDRDLGRLLERLEELGRLDDTLVVFTSDHGEALGERHVWFDHVGLFDNTLRVPLILAGPGVPEGVVVDEPVAGVDLVPTLVELLDLPGSQVERGVSVVGTWDGETLGPRERWFFHGNGTEVGYRDGEVHAILSRRSHERGTSGLFVPDEHLELYELGSDPRQLTDVAEEEPDKSESLRARILEWLGRTEDFGQAPEAALGVGDEEALRALGYLGD